MGYIYNSSNAEINTNLQELDDGGVDDDERPMDEVHHAILYRNVRFHNLSQHHPRSMHRVSAH